MAKSPKNGQDYAANCFDEKGDSKDYFSDKTEARVEEYAQGWLEGQNNGSYVIFLKPFKRIDKLATYATSTIK